jgi:hypothetical protein
MEWRRSSEIDDDKEAEDQGGEALSLQLASPPAAPSHLQLLRLPILHTLIRQAMRCLQI